MAAMLDEIESGAFAREFLAACEGGLAGLRAQVAAEADSALARTGRELRDRLAALGLH